MRRILLVLVFSLFSLFLSGCGAQKTTFVLLPDPAGTVGEITVSNAQGSQTLDKAGDAVVIKHKSAAPGQAANMSSAQIRAMFQEAMAIEPEQPEKFILYFMFDSIRLLPASEKTLMSVLDAAVAGQSMDIAVNGHTDRAGDEAYNYRLSLRRAEYIRQLLENRGVSSAFISSTSHGEGNPLVPTGDNVAEPRNRRVEVIIR